MINIHDFKTRLSPELLSEASAFLARGHIVSISESDDGCFDAVLWVGDAEHYAEVTLDADGNIEDACCPFCGYTLCIHTTAICIGVELMLRLSVKKMSKFP